MRRCGLAAAAVALVSLPFFLLGGSISSDEEFMKFFDEKVDCLKDDNKALWRQFKKGRAKTLRSLQCDDADRADMAFTVAALFESSEALNYLVEDKGFKPDSSCVRALAQVGNVEMCIELMEEYGVKADAATLAAAACGGSLELCKYLCETQGMDASQLSHLRDMLSCDEAKLKQLAADISILTDNELSAAELVERQREVAKYFIENGAPVDSPKAIKQLDNFENKELVAFLRPYAKPKAPTSPPVAEPEEEPEIEVAEEKPYDYSALFAQMEAASDHDAYIAVLKALSHMPDYRRFRVGEVVYPKEIPFEELSSREASQSTWWVTPSEVEILPTEESLKFYNEEIYPRLKAFFAKIGSGERTKTARVPVELAESEGTWTRTKDGILAMVLKHANSIFAGPGNFKVVLEKLEETDYSKLKPGSTVNCEVTIFDVPEAYQSFAQDHQVRYADAEVRIRLKNGETGENLTQYVDMNMHVGSTTHSNRNALVFHGFGADISRAGDVFLKVRRKVGRTWWNNSKGQKPASLDYAVELTDPAGLVARAARQEREREAARKREERERELARLRREAEQRQREEEERSPGYFDH